METSVSFLLGAVGMISGAAIAVGAGRFPSHRPTLERCAAYFIVTGVALIALAFPTI